ASVEADGVCRGIGRGDNRRRNVLLYSEIYASWLSADPAGSLSARPPRATARNGLPVLSQLCGSRFAFKCPHGPNLYELPPASEGAKSQVGSRACSVEWREGRRAGGQLGEDPLCSGLRLFQPCCSCEPGGELPFVPWGRERDESRLSA